MLQHKDLLIISQPDRGLLTLKISVFASLNVLQAATITEAEQIIEAQCHIPSLILTEVKFLEELVTKLQKHNQFGGLGRPYIIALTEDASEREKIINAGADDCLLLPILPQELNLRLSNHLRLSEMNEIQDEEQAHAAQMAFLVLLSRLISEHLDLDVILSRSLEQTVTLFNASCGDIWQNSNDEQYLELASSLSQTPFPLQRDSRRLKGQGILGKAIGTLKAVIVNNATEDPNFDPQIDHICLDHNQFCVLLVNLICRGVGIGLLALYRNKTEPFTRQDASLLENIAPFIATAIVNAQLMKSTRNIAEQQHILYEMSQQLTLGLDIHLMLIRAIQWIGRILRVEIGIIWLADECRQNQKAMAGTGYEIPKDGITIPLKTGIFERNPVIINSTLEISDRLNDLVQALQIRAYNALIMPMEHSGQIIGTVSLFNKFHNPFSQTDIKLLATMIEMITSNIRNAQLHDRTIMLLEEREQLHQQAIQTERLRTIGQLTASLVHEINNPMQVIRGALALALEDLENVKNIEEYIHLSQHEANRIIEIINRMRQLYRPPIEQPSPIDLSMLLNEVIDICDGEITRQDTRVISEISSNLAPIMGLASQLKIALISILLRLSNEIGSTGGGELSIRAYELQGKLVVEFLTRDLSESLMKMNDSQSKDFPNGIREYYFGLLPSAEMIRADNGKLDILSQDNQTLLRIQWPKA